MQGLTIKVDSQNSDCTVLHLTGEITPETSEKLRSTFNQLTNATTVNINLSEVTYIASAGVGLLVSFLRKLKEQGGRLTLSNLQEEIYELFCITHLDKVFVIDQEASTQS